MSYILSLRCPILPAINPMHEEVQKGAMAWLESQGLVQSPHQRSALESLRIPEFVSRAYPCATPERLRVVMDWTLWGFLADDQHDSLVGKPDLLAARYLEHSEVLESGLSGSFNGMHKALADIRERVLDLGGTACLGRFAVTCREWFESMQWEIRNRVRGEVPDVTRYLRMRELTVGMYTEYALFDATHGLKTDDAFWLDPDVRRLMLMTANIIGWANDLFSYPKESEARDPHNLVLLLIYAHDLSEHEATLRTTKMHNRELDRFLELEASVRERDMDPSIINPFCDLLRSWIRGNMDWSFSSFRYGLQQRSQEKTLHASGSARPLEGGGRLRIEGPSIPVLGMSLAE